MHAPTAPRVLARASSGALVATSVTVTYGDHRVLTDLSLTVAPSRRLALVGDNGSGKSTLLRVLAGTFEPDAGTVVRPPDTALLEQDLAVRSGTTVHDVIESALTELRAAVRHVQDLAALVQRLPDDAALAREYGDALEWAQLREAWDADHRVDRVMRGLGLAHMRRSRPVDELSGGERARVAMAALLVRQPLALLLDEPTNHLDDDAVAFLERHVRALPGVVVVAGHDRAFLDAVGTDVLDLDPSRGDAVRFGGSFGAYLAERRRERERWERAWADRCRELAELERAAATEDGDIAPGRGPRDNDKFVHAFKGARVERTVARRRRSARERIAALERTPIERPPDPLRFHAALGAAPEAGEPLVAAANLAVAGRLDPVSLKLRAGDRLLVTGPNGAGKSTLLEVLGGDLAPTTGSLVWRDGVRIARLVQDPQFDDDHRSAARVYASETADLADAPLLEHLGLLRAQDALRPVCDLSEGQRRRLALALLIAHRPEVLLLDEPTNHLSPALVSDLEAALAVTPAAVVLATHDRWMRGRWTGRRLQLG